MNTRSRNKLLLGLVAPAVALALAGPAAAQTAKSSSAMQAQDRSQHASARNVRASKLIGSDVRNAQGENLGEIKELIVDIANDRVYYAVLSFGGFLGLGDKLFAFPVRAFRQVDNDDRVILNIDKSRLKNAPGFDGKAFPDFNQPSFRKSVDGYHGPSVAVQSMPNQRLMRASELIGKDINDRNGADVGEVEDLVVSMGDGRIRYAVVEFDKAWSLNDKLLAVPMQALRHTSGKDDLVWDIDKSKIDAARAFDKNRWPDLNDPTYKVEVDRYLVVLVPTAAGKSEGAKNLSSGAGRFDRLDANRDSMLSETEARKDSQVHGMWKALDANKDGNVSRSEFAAKWQEANPAK